MVQEALTNIARHARATEVCIEMHQTGGELLLTVLDNGVGFDEAAMYREGSHGLMGMRERALMLGGQLEIGNSPGGGGRVTVRLPLAHAGAARARAPANAAPTRQGGHMSRPEPATRPGCCWSTTTPSCARGCGASSRRWPTSGRSSKPAAASRRWSACAASTSAWPSSICRCRA